MNISTSKKKILPLVIAAPMPALAPVTRATLPDHLSIINILYNNRFEYFTSLVVYLLHSILL